MYFRFNDNTVDNYGTVAKELSQHTPQERKNKLKFKNEDGNNEHNTYEVLCLLKEYIEKDKRFHKYSITKFNISKECFDIRISRYIECRTYTFYKSSGYTYDNSRDILDITHYETCWE